MRVTFDHVGKRFGAVAALCDLDLDLPSGSRTALVGPNGSGKSTLTRVLMGMLDYEGEVRIDGLSPRRDRVQLAPRTAYVPQIAPRLAVPVREIVAAVLALRDLDARAVEAAAAAMDLDLAAVAARPFRDLSGGMRQKLLIALALASRPELLVLDEPTASLDPRARQRFFDLVQGLSKRPTLLLCSHRLEEIRHLVDRVLVLDEGRCVFAGPATDWLRAHAGSSAIEVLVEGAAAGAWLAQQGFARTASGYWRCATTPATRAAQLRQVAAALDTSLVDVVVRDPETLDHRAQEPRP